MRATATVSATSAAPFVSRIPDETAGSFQKITVGQIATFFSLLGLILTLGPGSAWLLLGRAPLGDFRGMVLVAAVCVSTLAWALLVYRLFLKAFPLGEGTLLPGTREAFAAQVNILFYLMLFNSLVRTHVIPVPIMRLIYKALGAKLGPNTYSAGSLLDPPLTELGADCIVGHDAVLFAHAIEGGRFSLAKIRVGNGVTIGALSVIMSGVTIGDGALICAGAVVPKNTKIGPGEIWGGIPARRIR